MLLLSPPIRAEWRHPLLARPPQGLFPRLCLTHLSKQAYRVASSLRSQVDVWMLRAPVHESTKVHAPAARFREMGTDIALMSPLFTRGSMRRSKVLTGTLGRLTMMTPDSTNKVTPKLPIRIWKYSRTLQRELSHCI